MELIYELIFEIILEGILEGIRAGMHSENRWIRYGCKLVVGTFLLFIGILMILLYRQMNLEGSLFLTAALAGAGAVICFVRLYDKSREVQILHIKNYLMPVMLLVLSICCLLIGILITENPHIGLWIAAGILFWMIVGICVMIRKRKRGDEDALS